MEEGLMEDGGTLTGTRDCSVDEADIFSSFAVLRWDGWAPAAAVQRPAAQGLASAAQIK